MGAKDWMIFFAERDVPDVLQGGPEFDRDGAVSATAIPDKDVTAIEDVSLAVANPPDDEVYAAIRPNAAVVCAAELGLHRPSGHAG